MKFRHRKLSKGFTLIELIVVIALLTGMAVYGMDGLSGALNYKSRVETDNKLKAWRGAVENVYSKYSTTIDANTAAVIDLGATPIAQALPNGTTRRCNLPVASVTQFARFAGYSPRDLIKDGFGGSLCLLITPRQTDTIAGTTLYYHSIALVSGGGNGKVDTTTKLDAAGNLNIDPTSDDVGILFDGRKFSTDRYNQTVERLTRSINAYNAYYAARYQSDASRSLGIDYFSCGSDTCTTAVARWDSAGLMPSTCTAAISMVRTTGISPHSVLGLSQTDVTDGWGNLFSMDNCTDTVRSPGNTLISKQTPPYTAVISATLPGGAILSVTAVGQI